MALVKHSVLMAKSYCIPIFKVSYNVPIINILLRFILFRETWGNARMMESVTKLVFLLGQLKQKTEYFRLKIGCK